MEATIHQMAPLFLHGAYNREGKKMKEKLNEEIVRQGSSPALWTAYIRRELQEHITLFQKAKADHGESFPDLIGAYLMDDLDSALSLKAIREKRSEEKREQLKKEMAEKTRTSQPNLTCTGFLFSVPIITLISLLCPDLFFIEHR